MTKDIIPKAENTSEIIQNNLLRYTFITKRQSVRRNAVPAKYRNNYKSTIDQLSKELDGIVQNVNATLRDSTLKQDEKYKEDITKLHNRREHLNVKLKHLREIDHDLTKEVDLCVKNNKKMVVKSKNPNSIDKWNIHRDVEQILLQKTRWYNKGLARQSELRNKLDAKLREIALKNKIYESLMSQLGREAITLSDLGDSVSKAYQQRQQALNDLIVFQRVNNAELKQLEKKMYFTRYILRNDLDSNAFLIRKCTILKNQHHNSNIKMDTTDENKKKEEFIKFLKFLTHIGGDTDLSAISDTIENIKNNKDSLFRLCMFFEQLFVETENGLRATQQAVARTVSSIGRRRETAECRTRSLAELHRANDAELSSKRALADDLTELCDAVLGRVHGLCQALQIGPAALGVDGPPDEANMSRYAEEMEKRSDWILFKLNCIENSCLMGHTEDPLTSDAESTQNLTAKDLDGVEIKMRRLLDMEDASTLPVPDDRLDVTYTPSPCPHCVEARFIESGYCNLLNANEMIPVKDDVRSKLLCCAEMIKTRKFENINPKLNPELFDILHEKSNCKRTLLNRKPKKKISKS